MGCARNPSHFMFIDFLMSYQFQLLVFSSNVFERPCLLTVDCVDCRDCRTYSQCCFTLQQKKARHVQHLRTSRVSWSCHDLSFRSWRQALCLGSQAIRINKESNISKSILVQRKTFASEKCFFLSFDLSSILSSPSLLVSVYPLLHSFALLSNFPIYPHTTKSLSFFLSRSRKECAFTLAGAVFGREGGRDIAISKSGETKNIQKIS